MALHDISRKQAGLRAPKSRTTFRLSAIQAKVIHYSTGEELGKPSDTQWWREIQAYHMGRDRNYADIGYAYGIHARMGRILEGRGIGVVAAHSPGWNARSVSLVVLGDDDPGQDVLAIARTRIRKWSDDVDRLLGRKVPVLGHRQTQKKGYTQCPGDEIADWLEAGMPVGGYDNNTNVDVEEDEMAIGPNIKGRSRTIEHYQKCLVNEAKKSGRLDGNPLREYGPDGYWGEETERAVRAYQAGAQIPVTGVIDGVTADLLTRYE